MQISGTHQYPSTRTLPCPIQCHTAAKKKNLYEFMYKHPAHTHTPTHAKYHEVCPFENAPRAYEHS